MKKILLFIASGLVAVASVFTFNLSIPSVSASSQPITNSVNATGTKTSTNLLGGINNMYYAYTSNWNIITDVDATSRWLATGVDVGPATGVDFIDTQPNIALVVWSNNGAIPAFTPITVSIQYQQANVNIRYYQGNSNGVTATLTRSEETYNLYYNYTFVTTQWTSKIEIRFKALSTTVNTKFVGAIYVGSYDTEISMDTAYNEGVTAGVEQANNTVNTNSASYNAGVTAGVEQANNTVNTNSASYDAGYTAGSNDAGSLSNLFSGVLEAPVHVVLDTLNFEIFGVDVSTFVLSLLTVGFIAIIFKLLL